MTDIGWAELPIKPTFGATFDSQVDARTSRALAIAGDRGGAEAGRRFSSRFTSVLRAGVAGAAGLTYVGARLGSDWIDAASDADETSNKALKIFGDQYERMERFASRSAELRGISAQGALDFSSQFGDMFSQIGFADTRAAKMSRTVVQLATDLGSFNNMGTEDVLERISAGFRGEFDSLQKLIPNINAARVETEALAMTGRDSADALTAQEKAAAVLAIVQKDGARAAGDFADTSKGNANQQKILAAQYDDLSAKLGDKLLPAQVKVMRFLTGTAMPALEDFSSWFDKEGRPAIDRFIDDARPLAEDLFPTIKDAAGDVRDIFGELAPLAKDVFDGFNNLPDGVKKGLLVGGGLLTAKRFLGSNGAAASAARTGVIGATRSAVVDKSGQLIADRLLARFQRPLPVIVMNRGFGAAGGGGGALVGGDGPDRRGGRPSRAGGTLRSAGALGAAFLGADLLTDVLGWEQASERERTKMEQFTKTWGTSWSEQIQKAKAMLADQTGFDLGKGPFGIIEDVEGLSRSIESAPFRQQIELARTLRTEYGLTFGDLERNGRLVDGFTERFRSNRRAVGGAAAATADMGDKLADFWGEADRSAQSTRYFGQEAERAGRRISRSSGDLTDFRRGAGTSAGVTSQLSRNLDEFWTTADRSAKSTRWLGQESEQTRRRLRVMGGQTSDVAGRVSDLASDIRKVPDLRRRVELQGMDRALRDTRTLLALLPGVGAFGSAAAAAASVANDARRGGGGGAAQRGGVTVNVGNMQVQDYRDMQRQLQQRAQRANLGGHGP